jgi:hypothetical protein
MPIELGKIREFARATKALGDAYAQESPAPIPATFLMTAAFWQGRQHLAPGFPANFKRLLHGEQEFVFHRGVPHSGEQLTGQQRVRRTWEKEGRRGGTMLFYEVVTEFRDPEGKLRAESVATLIETARAPVREIE